MRQHLLKDNLLKYWWLKIWNLWLYVDNSLKFTQKSYPTHFSANKWCLCYKKVKCNWDNLPNCALVFYFLNTKRLKWRCYLKRRKLITVLILFIKTQKKNILLNDRFFLSVLSRFSALFIWFLRRKNHIDEINV